MIHSAQTPEAPVHSTALPKVQLLGMGVHALRERQAIDHVIAMLQQHTGGWIITPNLDHLRRFTLDPAFAAYFPQADLVLCDGHPLVWASRVQGTPLPERVAGADLIWSLSAAAAANAVPIYLLGGDPGTAEAAGEVMRARFPALRIVGVECPAFGFEQDVAGVAAIVERLQSARPGIVFVALGSPKQEQFIARVRHCLPQAWFVGVGISFSFVSGRVKRAPVWLRRVEWMHRLLQEPRRLSKRYLVDDLPFMAVVLKRALGARFGRTAQQRSANSPQLPADAANTPERTTLAVERSPLEAKRRHTAATLPHSALRTYPSATIKSRLSAMVLLAGRLRATDLGRRAGRSRLDLPIDAHRTLLTYWRDEAADLFNAWHVRTPAVRVLLDQASPMPAFPAGHEGLSIALERDHAEFRGTGGVLRDACAQYGDDDWILVGNAAQMLFASLRDIADSLAEAGGEINVVHDRDGIPNGLILLRCGVLRDIPAIGYHDLKEQIIPALAHRHSVKVVSTGGITSHPIHSLKDYTRTLRAYHGRSTGRGIEQSTEEHWASHFEIREPGAQIAPTAIVHDAVILQGAVVEKGAVVVRSVVSKGARVRAGQKVFDEVVV